MSKKFRRKKKNLKLIIFLMLLLCTSLGYAIYTQELVINGNISGSADFRVYFAEAWIKHSNSEEDHTDTPNGKDEAEIGSGTVEINTSAGADTVTFDVTLNYPGDKVLIGTRIKNESSMRVKLNDFLVTKSVDIPDITISYLPLDTTTEKLDPNGECIYEFVVEWVAGSSDTNPGPVRFDIELDYEQDPDPAPTPVKPSHDHGEGEMYTAYFDANGGEVLQSFKNITHGQMYGMLPTPTRGDYEFLGWYTAVDGGTQVTAGDIVTVENDITLYAKWNYVGHSIMIIASVEPTCTEVGNIAHYKCTSCNRLYSDEEGTTEITDIEIPALGHDFEEEYTIDVEATCTEAGEKSRHCSRCIARTDITEIPMLAHTVEEYTLTTAAACETAGVESGVCEVCSTPVTRSVSALGHDFAVENEDGTYLKSEATCTANGVYYKSCSRCSTSSNGYTNTTFTTDKLPHTYTAQSQTETYLKQSAQCSGTGVQGQYYYKCANCTASSKGDTNTYYSTGTVAHNYNSKTTTSTYSKSSATCQAAATYYYKCQWCTAKGSSYYSSGSKADHSYTANCTGCSGNGYSWISANANWYYCYKGGHCIAISSCSTHGTSGLAGGYRAIKYCSKCGKSGSLYYPYSNKGSGKQCKWCGTAKK